MFFAEEPFSGTVRRWRTESELVSTHDPPVVQSMRHRWTTALSATKGREAWRRRLIEAVVVALAIYIGLRLWGSEEGTHDQIIVALVAIPLTFLILPVLAFSWNFLWVPWYDLKAEVERLKDASTSTDQSKVSKTIPVRLNLKTRAQAGRELLSRSEILGAFAPEAKEAGRWARDVAQFLTSYVSIEAAEQFMDAADEEAPFQSQLRSRVKVLDELAETAPTSKRFRVPKGND